MPTPEQQQLAAMLSGVGEAQQRAVSPGGDVAQSLAAQEYVQRAMQGEPLDALMQEAAAKGIPQNLLMQAITNASLSQRASPDPTAPAAAPPPTLNGAMLRSLP